MIGELVLRAMASILMQTHQTFEDGGGRRLSRGREPHPNIC